MAAAASSLLSASPFIQRSNDWQASVMQQQYQLLALQRTMNGRLWWRPSSPFSRLRISAASESGSRRSSQASSPLTVGSELQISTLKIAFPFPQVFRHVDANKGLTLIVTVTIFCVALLINFMRSKDSTSGSVEDLVKRGQLRYDRKSDSRPLRYEDPFNNPMVKVCEKDVKMYGKSFRLQPVTLTQEKMRSHQHRRVQAYQWKRPTVFLVEGEPVPEGVDPDSVRWIPPNHPFATAKNDFDEAAAEKNVYQTRGVPSRLRAEHEALRKRMMEDSEKIDFPTITQMPSAERSNVEKHSRSSSEQVENWVPSRPIRPFERPDVSISRKTEDNSQKTD